MLLGHGLPTAGPPASDLVANIQKQREDLIINRLTELNIEFSIEDEKRRVFKRLVRIIDGDIETVYFNDGSIDGLRIITFVTKQLPSNPEKMNIGYETTYY